MTEKQSTNQSESVQQSLAGIAAMNSVVSDVVGYLDKQSQGIDDVLKTGFVDLDNELEGGLHPNHVILLTALHGTEKITLALNIATHAAISSANTLYMSFEWSRLEIGLKLIASQLELEIYKVQKNFLSKEEWSHCMDVARTSFITFLL